MKVTAETITDEQIGQLHDEFRSARNRIGQGWCNDARVGTPASLLTSPELRRRRRTGRARCADAWNARHGDKP